MSKLPETIKALRIREERDDLDLVDVPFASRPDIQNIPEGYVLLKVRAVGLNPIDWKTSLWTLGTTGGIVGCDAAGDIVAVGPGVTHLKVGDRAAGLTMGHGFHDRPGAFAEYVLYSASGTFKIPDNLSYKEGAALPIPFLTAVQTLYLRHKLSPPSSPSTSQTPILIWGGSTAVGHYAIQLASISGYKVFATASPAVFDDIKKLGASEVFDYKDPKTPKKIQEAAGPNGISIAVDTVAEHGTTELNSLQKDESKKNTIWAILPVPPKVAIPANTSIDFTLVYTILGYPFQWAHSIDYAVQPEDVSGSLNFIQNELPPLFEGGKIKLQKLREMPGGLESVIEGLRILKEGKYGREKIVYTIA